MGILLFLVQFSEKRWKGYLDGKQFLDIAFISHHDMLVILKLNSVFGMLYVAVTMEALILI